MISPEIMTKVSEELLALVKHWEQAYQLPRIEAAYAMEAYTVLIKMKEFRKNELAVKEAEGNLLYIKKEDKSV